MSIIEFAMFLELLMCSDPWPVSGICNEKIIKEYANEVAAEFGYDDWTDAYHNMDINRNCGHKIVGD